MLNEKSIKSMKKQYINPTVLVDTLETGVMMIASMSAGGGGGTAPVYRPGAGPGDPA